MRGTALTWVVALAVVVGWACRSAVDPTQRVQAPGAAVAQATGAPGSTGSPGINPPGTAGSQETTGTTGSQQVPSAGMQEGTSQYGGFGMDAGIGGSGPVESIPSYGVDAGH